MRKLIICLLLSLGAVVEVTAQGTSPAAKGTVQSPQKADVPAPAGAEDNKVKAKLNDATFVEKAAMSGLAEVETSMMASTKASTIAIRDFASTMVKDHAEANRQLRTAARSSGTPIPETLDKSHTEIVNKFTQLSGRDFDEAYVKMMKQDHDAAVALFENAAGDESLDPALRMFAIQKLDTLRNHQLRAHNLLAGEIKGEIKK